ncbi:MAG: hypothetical protein HYV54_02320 [Parcubacteria group bacterium]|nr:hypothetical protein [Parcubacteria group bacterium]
MKARLLVHVILDGEFIHQELPEVEFDHYEDLNDAIQIKWHRINAVADDPKSPNSVLFNLWRKHDDDLPKGSSRPRLCIAQVIIL